MIRRTLPNAQAEYIKYLYSTKAKSRLTIEKEDYALTKWSESFRDLSTNRLTLAHIREFASERSHQGVSNRTINLDVIALHNMLQHFQAGDTDPKKLPTEFWTPLTHKTPVRTLMPADTLDKLCTEALNGRHAHGQLITDYLRLLAYSGCRKRAALSARWANVDWENNQISFLTKFQKTVVVDFNPALKKHLLDMKSRQLHPEWLFPSPKQDGHLIEPQELFDTVRRACGLEDITLHDFRHAFISRAVMAGIDILTIARWVGHADGGVLIGRVYGHLNNQHLKDSAAKLSL